MRCTISSWLFQKECKICAFLWNSNFLIHFRERRGQSPDSYISWDGRKELQKWKREQLRRRVWQFCLQGQTMSTFYSLRLTRVSLNLSTLPNVLFLPLFSPLFRSFPPILSCNSLHSAGNRRTLHTWTVHLTHTYESLKLNTHMHMHISVLYQASGGKKI